MTALSRSDCHDAIPCPVCGSANRSAVPGNSEADNTSALTSDSLQTDYRECWITVVTAIFLGGFSLVVFFSAIAQFSVEGAASQRSTTLPGAVRQRGQSLLPYL